MIWRFIMALAGWRSFKAGRVQIFQRDVLVDQTLLAEALTQTRAFRTWCDDDDLTVYIEANAFTGVYGTRTVGEVSRYRRGRKRAVIRVSGRHADYSMLVDLCKELSRVD